MGPGKQPGTCSSHLSTLMTYEALQLPLELTAVEI